MGEVVARPLLRRPRQGRWVAGVAVGLSAHLGVPVLLVRGVLAVLVLAGGAGVMAYVLLWALVPGVGQPSHLHSTAAALRGSGRGSRSGAGSGLGSSPGRGHGSASLWADVAGEVWTQLCAGAALLAVGASLLAERAGWAVDSGTVVAAVAVLGGVVLAWSRLDERERDRWLSTAGGDTRGGLARLAAGMVLTSVGLVLLVTGSVDASALGGAVLAAVAVLGGAFLLLAPWGLRLVSELREERARRIRATERAEIAAHLHDSVLQTLALIQRRSGDGAEVARLARAQERHLRSWLYDGVADPASAGAGPGMVTAVRQVVAEVEDEHAVPVDVVAVGDAMLDEGTRALVQSVREAVLNAVRHAAPPVSVYVEAGGDAVSAFVRDHGGGVDLAAVPADRLGIRQSIVGRMARCGGSAVLRRAPGGGTEVALRLPVTATAVPTVQHPAAGSAR